MINFLIFHFLLFIFRICLSFSCRCCCFCYELKRKAWFSGLIYWCERIRDEGISITYLFIWILKCISSLFFIFSTYGAEKIILEVFLPILIWTNSFRDISFELANFSRFSCSFPRWLGDWGMDIMFHNSYAFKINDKIFITNMFRLN